MNKKIDTTNNTKKYLKEITGKDPNKISLNELKELEKKGYIKIEEKDNNSIKIKRRLEE